MTVRTKQIEQRSYIHCIFITEAKLVTNTAKKKGASSDTWQEEISAESKEEKLSAARKFKPLASSREGKASQQAIEEASGTHCKLGKKKANVTAAKSNQPCCKIFNAQHTKRDNFIRAVVKVMYDNGKT